MLRTLESGHFWLPTCWRRQSNCHLKIGLGILQPLQDGYWPQVFSWSCVPFHRVAYIHWLTFLHEGNQRKGKRGIYKPILQKYTITSAMFHWLTLLQSRATSVKMWMLGKGMDHWGHFLFDPPLPLNGFPKHYSILCGFFLGGWVGIFCRRRVIREESIFIFCFIIRRH